MALRVTRREAEAASTPAYQAPMTVRRRPKARMATATPRIVRPLRSLLRKAFLKRILIRVIGEVPLVQMPQDPGPGGGPGVMGDHDDRLAHLDVEAFHHVQNLSRGGSVQVSRRLIGDEERWIRDNGPGDGHTLLLTAGHLLGVMVHAVFQPHEAQSRFGVLPAFPFGQGGEMEGQLYVLFRPKNGDGCRTGR